MKGQNKILREKTEILLREELEHLTKTDRNTKPAHWNLSPGAVLTFIMGGEAENKYITPKYIGDLSLMETAIATLATDRALLLTGVPGTAKSRVAEHLTAAITGDTRYIIQGSSATTEEDILFGWNYASLIARGPTEEALIPGPVARAMKEGKIVRIEELTRIPAMIQDNLLSILSEKMIAVSELDMEIRALRGFNLIATSNDRDRGTYPLSDALKRRFNVVHLPLPTDPETEVNIIKLRISEEPVELSDQTEVVCPEKEIRRIVQIFRELREGITADGKQKIKPTDNVLSTAEAISAVRQSAYMAVFFGNGKVTAREVAATLPGSIVKDPEKDGPAWDNYQRTIIAQRKEWEDLADALKVRHSDRNSQT